MEERDPFLLDPEEQKKNEEKLKGRVGGELCRLRMYGEPCEECREVRKLFNSESKQDIDEAKRRMAKAAYYLNVVFQNDPNTVKLLEISQMANNDLVKGINEDGWVDVAHPKAGIGRDIKLSKYTKDKRNQYSIVASLNKAMWSIPDETLTKLYNLDNILNILKTVKPIRAFDMKVDESMTFRICPSWIKDGEQRVKSAVWRHYGNVPVKEEQKSQEFERSLESAKTKKESIREEPCLGNKDFLDVEDEACKKCGSFSECVRRVKGV